VPAIVSDVPGNREVIADDRAGWLVPGIWGGRCALYVVESADGYATSMGDSTLNESFAVLDHEGGTLTVPLADCVSWDYARRAMVRWVSTGWSTRTPSSVAFCAT